MKNKYFLFRFWAMTVIAVCFCGLAFAQTHISDRAGLENIKNDLAGSYVLDNDIDLSGGDWTPLGDFIGMLNGNNHVIYNLRIDNKDAAALFGRIKDNAVVKNLGFENAYVTDATHARTAVLAAFMEGSALIENCYVANSTILGRWCAGSFVGRAQNTNNAIIRNCYSSAVISVADFSGGAGHAGGIIGNIFANGVTVENCYFSGNIQRILGNNAEGEVAGIVGWNGKGGPNQENVISTIKNNVNLGSHFLSNYGKHRIAGSIQDKNGGDPNPGPNYSLSTTIVSTYGDWENTTAIIPTDGANYGVAKKDGANIPDGDAAAKTQNFYATTLGWDFTGIWKIDEGSSYPYFAWQKDTTSFVVVPKALALTGGEEIDLSRYIFSGRGLNLSFTTDDNTISVTPEGVVSISAPLSEVKTVTVEVREGDMAAACEMKISLTPSDIPVSSRAHLEIMRTVPYGNFYLTRDLDLSDEVFTPIENFTGTLDGKNHVIFGLTTPQQEGAAFFKRISGDAVVKNLGFENANVDGGWNIRAAVLTGYMEGNALIENCYVANSTVSGRWCVGSFVGRAVNTTNAAIRNCYSSAYLYSPFYTNDDGTGHTGGIIGNIFAGGVTVENCYFSGIIQKEPTTSTKDEGQVAGIVGWIGKDGDQTITGYTVQKNVNLAPYLLSNHGKHRISSTRSDDVTVNDPTRENYSLSTTVVSEYNTWGSSEPTITPDSEQYGDDRKDGANISDEAKMQDFYETTLSWDFSMDSVWKIDEGSSYPYFQWADQTRPHFVVAPVGVISLTIDEAVDLSRYIFSGRGLDLTFGTESGRIALNGSVATQAVPSTSPDTVVVWVQEGSLAEKFELKIELVASAEVLLSNLTVEPGTLSPAFRSSVYEYTVAVGSDVESVTLTATPANDGVTITGDGLCLLSADTSELIVIVTAAGSDPTTYTYRITVCRPALPLPPSSDASLSNLTASPGALSPAFQAGVYGYTVAVDSGVKSITLTATAAHAGASVTGDGAHALSADTSELSVVVTAEDGNTTQTYKVKVCRAPAVATAVSATAKSVLRVYPNPVTDGELKIENGKLRTGEKVEVYSLSGVLVAAYEVATGDETAISVAQLPQGVYIVKVGNYAAKVVIK